MARAATRSPISPAASAISTFTPSWLAAISSAAGPSAGKVALLVNFNATTGILQGVVTGNGTADFSLKLDGVMLLIAGDFIF